MSVSQVRKRESKHSVRKILKIDVLTMNKPVALNLAKCKNRLTLKDKWCLTIARNKKAEVLHQLLDLLVVPTLRRFFEWILCQC